jgi:hypothetical protein
MQTFSSSSFFSDKFLRLRAVSSRLIASSASFNCLRFFEGSLGTEDTEMQTREGRADEGVRRETWLESTTLARTA